MHAWSKVITCGAVVAGTSSVVAVFARRGERVLFVKAAGGLEFGVVAAAIDIAHGVNIDRVGL